jgi:hypothetical protein
MVDEAPHATKYCSDGYNGYSDVDYYGAKYVRNCHNKRDTHNVESVNADLRCFIAGLQLRSRCFFRKIETLEAVLDAFVDACNKFGEYKLKSRKPTVHRPGNENKHLHHYRDLPRSLLDFICLE